MTKRDIHKRLNEYTKGSESLITLQVKKCSSAERYIGKQFKNDNKINKASDSNEWFYCNNEKHIVNKFINCYLNYDNEK